MGMEVRAAPENLSMSEMNDWTAGDVYPAHVCQGCRNKLATLWVQAWQHYSQGGEWCAARGWNYAVRGGGVMWCTVCVPCGEAYLREGRQRGLRLRQLDH